jgi:hypothetical protein
MKLKLVLAALLLAASSAFGTVTLTFNSAGGALTNFTNASTSATSAFVWGIVIDTAGNGFSYNQANVRYDSAGVTYTGSSLQSLNLLVNGVAGGASDDVLFLSLNRMNIIGAAGADGAPEGVNRVTGIASVPFGVSGIGVGDAFAVVWFDTTVTPAGGAVQGGTSFGAVTVPGFTIPADSATVSFGELFAGPDPAKSMNFAIGVPEPSSMLLGLLGAVGLLRRRR